MVRKMQLKFIIIAMSALILMLVAIFISTNLYMSHITKQEIDNFLENIIENDGRKDPKPISEDFFATEEGGSEINGVTDQVRPPIHITHIDGASFYVDQEGGLLDVIFNDEDFSDSTIIDYAKSILQQEGPLGNIENYRYQYKATDEGYLMAMANVVVQNSILETLLWLSIAIGGISFVLLSILIIILSKYITRPVSDTLDRQKKFISDSSHELKTPLAIISTNLDVLEMELGENNKISAIGDGVKRMSTLINELLILAKTEQWDIEKSSFNLSDLIESIVLPLEVLAYDDYKTFELKIKDQVYLNGNEEAIRKMMGALLENAVKYSKPNSVIEVSLSTKNDTKIISVLNQGVGVTQEQKEHLFDKFYRVDDSRHRETGGHGIGLSIVKNVVDMHKGKILVESIPNEYIEFKVYLKG